MSNEEFEDLVKLYNIDTKKPAVKAAYRVHVQGEGRAEAAQNEGVNYHTAIHTITSIALKYQIYLTVKERIVKEATVNRSK